MLDLLASNLTEKIAGTWLFLMLLLIVVLWVGLASNAIRAFFDALLGRAPVSGATSNADIDALNMRAKDSQPPSGNKEG